MPGQPVRKMAFLVGSRSRLGGAACETMFGLVWAWALWRGPNGTSRRRMADDAPGRRIPDPFLGARNGIMPHSAPCSPSLPLRGVPASVGTGGLIKRKPASPSIAQAVQSVQFGGAASSDPGRPDKKLHEDRKLLCTTNPQSPPFSEVTLDVRPTPVGPLSAGRERGSALPFCRWDSTGRRSSPTVQPGARNGRGSGKHHQPAEQSRRWRLRGQTSGTRRLSSAMLSACEVFVRGPSHRAVTSPETPACVRCWPDQPDA
jgi:hypothetical protein